MRRPRRRCELETLGPERERKHRLPASHRPGRHLRSTRREAAEISRRPRRHRPPGWRGPPTTSRRRLSPRLRLIPGRERPLRDPHHLKFQIRANAYDAQRNGIGPRGNAGQQKGQDIKSWRLEPSPPWRTISSSVPPPPPRR